VITKKPSRAADRVWPEPARVSRLTYDRVRVDTVLPNTQRGPEGEPGIGGTGRACFAAARLPSLANVASVKDIRGEVREFLTTRRAKITPERAGLPSYRGRRVAGLGRDEVALLAGISIEYYTRLERGNIRGASAEVLDGIAQQAVGSLRAEADRDPYDRALTDLVASCPRAARSSACAGRGTT
jgi:transcriptional regulator with XRE-family HTH domain